ncbi:MAG: hypothetical protein ACYDC1_05225 [Limisphaerales bacterium]
MRRSFDRCRGAGWWIATLTMAGIAADDFPMPPAAEALAVRVERLFLETKGRHAESPTNNPLAWQFARACFDWAEFATNDNQRASIATEGIQVSRAIVEREPDLAPARYYLAMNLGQLARTRTLGALSLVSEMEALFHSVRVADERFDEAGPDRCLGLLYRDAPGWPLSVGSRSKARRHLRRAVELAPEFPENRLNLIEGLLQWNDLKEARREAESTAALLPGARQRLSGDAWQSSWIDWDRRWKAMTANRELFPPRERRAQP